MLFLILNMKKVIYLFAFFCDYGNMFVVGWNSVEFDTFKGKIMCVYSKFKCQHMNSTKCAFRFHCCSLTFLSIQMFFHGIIQVLCIKFSMGCCSTLCFANVQKILGRWFYTKNMHNRAEHPADFIWIEEELFSLTLYLFYA